ncbi:MAG: hypothetical protein ABIP21_06000, partial [Acidimicrobiia bacterium]
VPARDAPELLTSAALRFVLIARTFAVSVLAISWARCLAAHYLMARTFAVSVLAIFLGSLPRRCAAVRVLVTSDLRHRVSCI